MLSSWNAGPRRCLHRHKAFNYQSSVGTLAHSCVIGSTVLETTPTCYYLFQDDIEPHAEKAVK